MKITPTTLPDVLLIEPDVYEDARGPQAGLTQEIERLRGSLPGVATPGPTCHCNAAHRTVRI